MFDFALLAAGNCMRVEMQSGATTDFDACIVRCQLSLAQQEIDVARQPDYYHTVRAPHKITRATVVVPR